MPVRVALQDAEVGAGLAALNGGDGHLLAMTWVASDWGVDAALVERHAAFYEGEIALDDFAPLHLPNECCQGAGVLCDDDEA